MKLRNKKTGEIEELGCIHLLAKNSKTINAYKRLVELNEEWEDYKPTEPLIKDEKIRKAVRAWAEANGIDESHYHNIEFNRSEHRLKWIRTIIEFDSIEGLENLCDGGGYTITDLCGKEEE